MKNNVAQELAFQLSQEDQVQTSFDLIRIVALDLNGSDEVVIRCRYRRDGELHHLEIDATETEVLF